DAAGDFNNDGFPDLVVGGAGVSVGGGDSGGGALLLGFDGRVIVNAKHTAATFTDVDGDIVTVTSNKKVITALDIVLDANGVVQTINLADQDSRIDGANITIKVRQA